MKNRNSILVAIMPVLACFALLSAQAIAPPPDGCYPNFNTAEGCNALQSIPPGVGIANTGVGWRALFTTGAGSLNTATGAAALVLNTTGSNNTATGAVAGLLNGAGANNNTAMGAGALENNVASSNNTAIGALALINSVNVAGGGVNTAVGSLAMTGNTTGAGNTGVGAGALGNATSGNVNTALGFVAGSSIGTGAQNIDIGAGVVGVAGENNTIRIGSNLPTGAGASQCFLGGILSHVTGVLLPVVSIDAVTGQLGVFTSSERFKKDIKPMDKASESIFALKPVSFRYKNDENGTRQFGLVAEEVVKVNPDLVSLDGDGKPFSVSYTEVGVLLLNEFLKEHKKVEEQQASISQLKSEMQTMVTQLKEQAAQIQKVSAQLQVSKPASQVVVNKP
jgi:trimeric autotransporter adhesin